MRPEGGPIHEPSDGAWSLDERLAAVMAEGRRRRHVRQLRTMAVSVVAVLGFTGAAVTLVGGGDGPTRVEGGDELAGPVSTAGAMTDPAGDTLRPDGGATAGDTERGGADRAGRAPRAGGGVPDDGCEGCSEGSGGSASTADDAGRSGSSTGPSDGSTGARPGSLVPPPFDPENPEASSQEIREWAAEIERRFESGDSADWDLGRVLSPPTTPSTTPTTTSSTTTTSTTAPTSTTEADPATGGDATTGG